MSHVVIQLFVQSLVVPTGRRVLLVVKSATVLGLWISSQPLKEFTQHVESSAGFVFSEDLPRHFFWCVSASSGPYHIVFKPDFLPTDDFFKWQVSCVSPTHPFPWQLQRRLDIGYEYWKWSALRYIMHGSVYPFWFRVNSALDERLLSLVDLDLFFLCSNHAM